MGLGFVTDLIVRLETRDPVVSLSTSRVQPFEGMTGHTHTCVQIPGHY